MNILFSKEATTFIGEIINSDNILLLSYDTDGCGCSVNGVPILIIVGQQDLSNLQQIKTNGFPLYIKKQHSIFFDENMEIKFTKNKLKLQSDNQIFTENLKLITD